ncbi:methyl-accepting chemotaxis protein-1 (serine sensor receptor) [Rhodoferax ferrireducens]|uniref:Methyl-accepting chemotaxis protein-1 (Serine sensor receptor) n=1 Tax=Rhodoferax ferrireducens TaxID=192843 RepID=A0ABU2C2C9_9BURK|nr:methyl-accepting chemotaxis protein [Rhodoferax ferrireducens]MDR7375483.1 methyl-accepting chemotaxis protein-1 (serine sensor receptor) [Rhodoferax ferrireducens]
MKLSLKLPLAFAAALVLVLCAALFGIYQLNQSLNTYQTTVQTSYGHERAISHLLNDFKVQVQEWKNVLLRGKNPEQLDRYWKAFQTKESEIVQSASALQQALPAGEARSLVERFAQAHQTMGAAYRKGFDAFKAADSDPAVGDKAVQGMDREPSKLLDEAEKAIGSDSRAVADMAASNGQRATAISLTIMLAACIAVMLASWRFSRTITTRLGHALGVSQSVASGDLTAAQAVTGKDELADLLNALHGMQTNLSTVVATVRSSAESVSSASQEIAAGNHDLSSRTEEQASALEQTAASMEELGATIRQNTDGAEHANQLAVTASSVAVRGSQVFSRAADTMSGITEASRKISDIIGVIDGIAFQTNILALNAAVEAARAGEQGRGFAVVASEVRLLAQRSADAAREIKALIQTSVQRMAQGSALVDESGAAMQEVVASIRRVTDIMGEISAASQEQSRGVQQISEAVTQIDQTTQQNAALVEESAAAADSLQHQAAELVRTVSVFRLSGAAPGLGKALLA